jgi:hypothetical protein
MNTREQERIRELEAEVAELHVSQAIERAARDLFIHPEHAPRIVPRDRITFDPGTRRVAGVKSAVEGFLAENPTYALNPSVLTPTGPKPPPVRPRAGQIDPYEAELSMMGKGGKM